MSVLVLAEHDNKALKKATLNALAAAQKIGGDIHVLVAGSGAGEAAKAASQAAGVKKVLHADAPHLADFLAENVSSLILSVAKNYSHILAPSTSNGKNIGSPPKISCPCSQSMRLPSCSELPATRGRRSMVSVGPRSRISRQLASVSGKRMCSA